MAELEGAADGGVRVHRQKDVLDQEVERATVDRDAGDLDTLDIDRGLAVAGTDAGLDGDGALAVEEFGHQPSGLVSLRAADLAEVDQGGAFGDSGLKLEARIANTGGGFVSDPGVDLAGEEGDAGAGAQTVGLDLAELLAGGEIVVESGGGSRQQEDGEDGGGSRDHTQLDGSSGPGGCLFRGIAPILRGEGTQLTRPALGAARPAVANQGISRRAGVARLVLFRHASLI